MRSLWIALVVAVTVLALSGFKPANGQDVSDDSTVGPNDEAVGVEIVDAVDLEIGSDLFTSAERGSVDTRFFDPAPRHLIKFGAVRFVPKWDEKLVYDDNVFLTEHDRQDDLILVTQLGFLSDYRFGGGEHELAVGYEMEHDHFLDNTSSDFDEHFAHARLDLGFNHLRLRISDRYEDRTDPVLAFFTSKSERQLNTLQTQIEWSEDVYAFTLTGSRLTIDYRETEFSQFDREEDDLILDAEFATSHDTWALASLSHSRRHFDRDALNDGRGMQAEVGWRLERDRLSGVGRLGVRFESFDDTVPTDTRDTAWTPRVDAEIRYQASRQSALEARYLHTSEFSATSNFQELDRGELIYAYQWTSSIDVRGAWALEWIRPSEGDAFRRFSIAAQLRSAVSDNIHLTFGYLGRFRDADAEDSDYRAQTWTIGIQARL